MSQLALFEPPTPDWDWEDAVPPPSDDREEQLRHLGLRYYQRQAVQACFEAWTRPEGADRSTLVVMATGLGKTQVFSAVAALWDKSITGSDRVLVCAHRSELVDQARARLEQMTGEYVEVEQAGFRASTHSRIVVASIDTIKQAQRLKRFSPDHFGLVIVDECFPAGTPIDGRPIETLKRGDVVRSMDHRTGTWKESRIASITSRYYPGRIITLRSGSAVIRCTANHPIWVKGKGYVAAESVAQDDVLCVWRGLRDAGSLEQPAAHHLLPGVPEPAALRDDGGYESRPCLEAHDRPQPHAERGDSLQGGADLEGDRACSPDAGRKRDGALPGGDVAHGGSWGWVGVECGDPYQDAAWGGLPHLLQAGPAAPEADGVHRGGRGESRDAVAPGAGPKEGDLLAWARVDSVESHEPASPEGTLVYSLEVEETGTYFANGILVHNCHHYLATTYRKPLDYFKDAKLLGVTATPDRGDAKALGQLFDSVAYVHDILDGIEAGYLAQVVARQRILEGLDLDTIDVQKGDLVASQLDDAMIEHVEGVVQTALELAPDRQTILFFPGVKTAELAAERLNVLHPGKAGFISGKTPDEERREIVRAFKRGSIQWLANCMVATEGFDAPACSCIVVARPTQKRGLYAQMAGRGTRVLPGLVEGFDGEENAALRRDLVARSAKPNCLLIDVVGVGTKCSLVGPPDLLGGKYTDDEVKHAKVLAQKSPDPGRNVTEYLEQARRELRALAQTMKTRAELGAVREFDPFAIFNLPIADEERYATFRAPATAGQLDLLRRKGVEERDLSGLSRRAANKLVKACNERKDKGLCTFKQLRQLRKRGVTETDIPFAVAGRAMDYIATHGWGRGPSFDPSKLNAIIMEGMRK